MAKAIYRSLDHALGLDKIPAASIVLFLSGFLCELDFLSVLLSSRLSTWLFCAFV